MTEIAANSTLMQNDETDPYWSRLQEEPEDMNACEALVNYYRPLVRMELLRARARLPRHIDSEELEAAGLEALFMSIRAFQREFNVQFENYARKRIWGAIIDRVRSLDGLPRTAWRAVRVLSVATQSFAQRHHRTPDAAELAAETGLSQAELDRTIRQAQLANKLSLDALGTDDENHHEDRIAAQGAAAYVNPLHLMAAAEVHGTLVDGLKQLPERERAILVLYYQEGVLFNEIAAAMEVSESRISHMHAQALKRLKEYLRYKHMGIGEDRDEHS